MSGKKLCKLIMENYEKLDYKYQTVIEVAYFYFLQIRRWPHSFSFLFACLSCTLGMFSISRFAILSIEFGPIFIVQFLLLSLLFGIPLFLFFVSTGQYLGSGIIDMWRISPIFQVSLVNLYSFQVEPIILNSTVNYDFNFVSFNRALVLH